MNKPVPDERNNVGKGSIMVASRCVVHVLQNDPAPYVEMVQYVYIYNVSCKGYLWDCSSEKGPT